MSEFQPYPFTHVPGENNELEKAKLKADRAEREKAKRVRGIKSVIASAGVVAAIGLGAKEMMSAKASSGERQTPTKEAPQNPAVAAREKRDQDIEAANAAGLTPETPDYDKIGEELRAEDPE